MKDEELKSLLEEFASPLHATAGRKPRRRISYGTLAVLGTAATALSIAIFIAAPRIATAAALRKIEAALIDAESMECDTFIHYGDPSKTRHTVNTLYKKGAWRMRGRIDTPLEAVYLSKGGRQFIYSPKHQTLTVEPMGEWGYTQDMSALDFAKSQTDFGSIGEGRTTRIETAARSDGTSVIRVILERKSDAYRTEIDVDPKTNLPLESRTEVTYTGAQTPQFSRMTYRFNHPIPDSAFDPAQFKLPILDLELEQKKLMEAWKHPLTQVGSTSIHHAFVNREGEIILVLSGPNPDALRPKPLGITNKEGIEYLATRSYRPGGVQGDTITQRHFKAGKDAFILFHWVPIEPVSAPPSKVVLDFGSEKVPLDLPAPSLDLSPPYSTALVLDREHDAKRIEVAKVRADAYRDRKEFVKELRWRWAQHEAAVAFVPRFGELQVNDLAKCLENLGQTEEAARVRRELGPQRIKRFP